MNGILHATCEVIRDDSAAPQKKGDEGFEKRPATAQSPRYPGKVTATHWLHGHQAPPRNFNKRMLISLYMLWEVEGV